MLEGRLNKRLHRIRPDLIAYLMIAACIALLGIHALVDQRLLSHDEPLEYQGVVDHARFAAEIAKGNKPDLHHDIIYNLENYGIAAKIIPYLAGLALGASRTSSYDALINTAVNTGHYFFLSHLFILACGLLTSYIAVKWAKLLGIKNYWLAGAICLLMPRFSGEFLLNIKDLPFALFYTSYSLFGSIRLNHKPNQAKPDSAVLLLASSITAGLMMATKIVAIAPIATLELLIILASSANRTSFGRKVWDGVSCVTFSFLFSLLLTPSSWLEPLRFLKSAISLFRNHDWPGGMWWLGTFMSKSQDPANWNTALYLARWIGSTTPIWLFVLLAISLIRLAQHYDALLRWKPWSPLFLQAGFYPLLAITQGSNVYDGVRHFLFVMPAIAVMAMPGLNWLLNNSRNSRHSTREELKKTLRAATLLLILLTWLDLITLSPYTSSYFSEPFRFWTADNKTSLDYWSISAPEATERAIGRANQSLTSWCLASTDLPDHVVLSNKSTIKEVDCKFRPSAWQYQLDLTKDPSTRKPDQICATESRWIWPGLKQELSSACLHRIHVETKS
ncbi:MAG: hypothetical protein QUV04_02350 [Synechococcus sp. WH 8007]|nr:hypothetical protein [Synechococcus sp. WH 8007]